MDPTVTLTRSSLLADTCEDQVLQETANDAITWTDNLDCAFAGRTVKYCLQYTSSVCRSFVSTKSIEGIELHSCM